MNIIKKVLSLAILIVPTLFAQAASAGGTPNWTATLTPAHATAPADNTTVTSVSIHAYNYLCTPTDFNNPITYTTAQQCLDNGFTGSNAAPATGETIHLYGAGPGYILSSQVTTDGSGNATFSVRSGTTAGTTTISAYYIASAAPPSHGSTSITFTAVAAATAAPGKPAASTPTPTTSAATATPEATATATPMAESILTEATPIKPKTLVEAISSSGGYIVVIVLGLALLMFLLHKLKIVKLPFLKQKKRR